jgi:hypothetical protein
MNRIFFIKKGDLGFIQVLDECTWNSPGIYPHFFLIIDLKGFKKMIPY